MAQKRKRASRRAARDCARDRVRLLHPFMPFITEEIWQQLPKPTRHAGLDHDHDVSGAPTRRSSTRRPSAQMALMQDVVVAVRNLRAEYNVKGKVDVTRAGARGGAGDARSGHEPLIIAQARIGN